MCLNDLFLVWLLENTNKGAPVFWYFHVVASSGGSMQVVQQTEIRLNTLHNMDLSVEGNRKNENGRVTATNPLQIRVHVRWEVLTGARCPSGHRCVTLISSFMASPFANKDASFIHVACCSAFIPWNLDPLKELKKTTKKNVLICSREQKSDHYLASALQVSWMTNMTFNPFFFLQS